MKRRCRPAVEAHFPAAILFMSGFLLGTILPNFFWEKYMGKLSAVYLLTLVRQGEFQGTELLIEIGKRRGVSFFLTVLSGFTVFGVPLAILEMTLLGFLAGSLLTVSILQLGLYGGITGVALLFPQYLFYYPSFTLLLSGSYHESRRIRKRRGAFPEKMNGYGVCILLSFSLALAGALLEAYVHPGFIKWIMKKLPLY